MDNLCLDPLMESQMQPIIPVPLNVIQGSCCPKTITVFLSLPARPVLLGPTPWPLDQVYAHPAPPVPLGSITQVAPLLIQGAVSSVHPALLATTLLHVLLLILF